MNYKIRNRWVVVFGALTAQMAIGALYAWSLFNEPIATAFEWKLDSVVTTYAVSLVSFALTMIFSGRLHLIKGPRFTALIGGVLYSTGILLSAFVTSPTMLYLTYGVMGGDFLYLLSHKSVIPSKGEPIDLKNTSENWDIKSNLEKCHIIPLALEKDYRVLSYKFNGYFRDVGTIESLYEANMDLIDNPQYLKVHEYIDSPVYTISSNLPPHHIGENCTVKNSMISDGCLIYGDLLHSIVSSGVVIEHGSKVVNSIIHGNAKIGKLCYLKNVILLENSVILPNTELIFDKVTVVDNEFLWKLGDSDA